MGEGTVILSSLFTDWGSAHGQASITELRLVRDLITFAKNPRKPIPVYDLSTNTNPSQLPVNIINNTDDVATKVKLTAYTPDRRKVLYQTEQNVNLAPGNGATIDLSFTLPTIYNTDWGICHVDYELFDAHGELIQMAAESDGGRFAVYYFDFSYTPSKP